MKKRILSMIIAIILVLGMLPGMAWADEAPTITSVVTFTVQAENEFLCAPQLDQVVSSDLAESYGYTDQVIGEVSALDVLVRAHEIKYDAAFTRDTASQYLTVTEQGEVSKAFERNDAFGFLINGRMPNDEVETDDGAYTGYSIDAASVKAEDKVEFFFYQDTEEHADSYMWFANYSSIAMENMTIAAGDYSFSSGNLKIYGYPVSYGAHSEEQIKLQTVLMEGAQLCLIDPDTGIKTEINGAVVNEKGGASVKAPTAGEYFLSAYMPDSAVESGKKPIIMPLFKLTAIEQPKLKSMHLYNGSNKTMEYTIRPSFDPNQLTGYNMVVPDNTTSAYIQLEGDDNAKAGGYSLLYTMGWGGFGADGNSTVSYGKGSFQVRLDNTWQSAVTLYTVAVKKQATLTKLAVDGIWDATFTCNTHTYSIMVDSKKPLIITPTAYNKAYTITINGQTATSGAAFTLENYSWDAEGKMSVDIDISGDNVEQGTYTLNLKREPLSKTPTILIQPTGGEYVIGDAAKAMTVKASASGDVSYQWYANTEDSISGGNLIEEADTVSYTPPTDVVGTTYYYCVATNAGEITDNTATTSTAKVAVVPDPTPTVSLAPTGTDIGGDYGADTGFVYDIGSSAAPLNVTYSSAVSGGTWSFRWYRATDAEAAGTRDTTWSSEVCTPKTTASDANNTGYWYYCTVRYEYNKKTYSTNTNRVYIYVKANEAATPVIEPNKWLVDKTYYSGDTAALLRVDATVSDGGTLTYQWYSNTKKSTEGATAIEGADQVSYQPATDQAGVTYFYCMVTNTLQGYTKSSPSAIVSVTVNSLDELIQSKFSGKGTETEPYQLTDTQKFADLAEIVGKGASCAGLYFQMTDDISLPSAWSGIGRLKPGEVEAKDGANIYPFSGILDGDNHTLTFAEGSKALFQYLREAAVKNLTIDASYLADYALLSNYVVDYGSDGSYYSGTGGSVTAGCPDTVDVINVTLKSGSIIKKGGFLGGYASGANAVNFTNCTVEQGVKIGWDKTAGASAGLDKVGSFGGEFSGSIFNCVSSADVYGGNNVGGLSGCKGQSMGPYKILNSAFHGTVNATGNNVGGIAGNGYYSSTAPNTPCATIQNCLVIGNVTGADKVGGIFGGESASVQCWENGAGCITDNLFVGTVSGTGNHVGGIIGYMQSLNRYNVVANNYYLAVDGLKGLGGATIVDTNCATHETESGAKYYNTDGNRVPELGSQDHNRTDDPLGTNMDKLAKALTTEELKNSATALLNGSSTSFKNWVQGENYPVLSTEPVVYRLTVSGSYKTEYYIGESLDLTGIQFTADWSNGTTTQPVLEEVTVEGFDNTRRAVQTLTLSYKAVKTTITVKVLLQPVGSDITVSFTLLGDSKHGDLTEETGTHTLKSKNLTTWIATKTYKVDLNATVEDVFRLALEEAELDWKGTDSQYNSIYISDIQIPGTSPAEYLGEFDNGNLSGWMDTVNGTHPEVGISNQFLNNGDAIVFHYTDDYTKEQGSEKWGGGVSSTSADQKAADAVKVLIDAIGTITKDSKDRIDAARSAYEKLTGAQKELVTNFGVLTKAESDYAILTLGVPFTDVAAHWALEAIRYVYENNLMNGMSTITFAPDLMLNRGMLVTVLYRLEGEPDVESDITYTDVATDAYYTGAVAWATENKIVSGYGNGLYGPGNTITREQMVTMLYRYAAYKGFDISKSSDLKSFTDTDKIGSWALDAIKWANAEALINGRTATVIAPNGSVTRGETAMILMRYCMNVAK